MSEEKRGTLGRPGVPAYPSDAATVTKSDATVFAPSHIYVGGAGDVEVKTEKGSTVTFYGVPAGFIVPCVCIQVRAATTATNITRVFD